MFGKKKRPFVSAVIVAAGSASRMDGVDKQLAELCGIPVVIRSVQAFEASRLIDEIVIVTRQESLPELNRLIREFGCEKVKAIVQGGGTRQQSVFRGVGCVSEECAFLAVHDGARPLVQTAAIETCLADAQRHGAAMLGAPVKDTLKRVDADGFIAKTVSRERMFSAHTPQIFEMQLYRRAMEQAGTRQMDYTDDCQLVEAVGQRVYVTRERGDNLKITAPEDLLLAQALLEQEDF